MTWRTIEHSLTSHKIAVVIGCAPNQTLLSERDPSLLRSLAGVDLLRYSRRTLYRPSMLVTQILGRPRHRPCPLLVVCLGDLPLHPSRSATTFSILPTPKEQLLAETTPSAPKNTLPLSSAHYVQRSLRVHTTCDRIFALTRTRGRLSAPSAAKHLLANTIERDMKAYTRERRSSSAKVNSAIRNNGGVVADLRARMLSAVISAQKQDVCVSSLCWTRKLPKDKNNGPRSRLSIKCKPTRVLWRRLL